MVLGAQASRLLAEGAGHSHSQGNYAGVALELENCMTLGTRDTETKMCFIFPASLT
jgi:hypothetical protein